MLIVRHLQWHGHISYFIFHISFKPRDTYLVPCLLDADWGLRSNGMPNSRLQATAELALLKAKEENLRDGAVERKALDDKVGDLTSMLMGWEDELAQGTATSRSV